MGRCRNSCENSQRRERVREERASRKKIRDGKRQRGREQEERRSKRAKKVETLRSTVFFICFVAPESRKVGSLKRWSRSHFFGRFGAALAVEKVRMAVDQSRFEVNM